MKTQISILVRNEFILTKATSSLWWFVKIFQKSKMLVTIDGKTQKLAASKTPYIFEVEPGQHNIRFEDPCLKGKSFNRKMVGLFLGFGFGLAADGSSAIGGAYEGYESFRLDIKEGVVNCELQDGDTLQVSCKAKANGKIKIKILN